MTRLEQLEQTIAALPVDEYRQLRDWIIERDWEAWDRQIEADSASGKLDFLLKEADEEKLLSESSKRLAELGGTEKELVQVSRRKSSLKKK
ncbi:MAG: hypothetical protein ABSA26_01755 [Thermoguttaceae bacterium]|jgi:hypothetical protein